MMPSAPTARAARASAGTNSRRPAAWLGSRITGRWLLLLDHRHRRHVERVAGRGLEGADAALAEDHLRLPSCQDVLGRQEQLLHRRHESALQQHRLAHAPHRLQQGVILHVAGADLQDVGVGGHRVHEIRMHDLGDRGQAVAPAGFGQKHQTLLAQALEAVGRGARLVGAAAQDPAAAGGDLAGARLDLLGILHRAGAGHDHELGRRRCSRRRRRPPWVRRGTRGSPAAAPSRRA